MPNALNGVRGQPHAPPFAQQLQKVRLATATNFDAVHYIDGQVVVRDESGQPGQGQCVCLVQKGARRREEKLLQLVTMRR